MRGPWIVVFMVFSVLALGIGAWLSGVEKEQIETRLAVSDALGSDTTGYNRALGPRAFSFPEDHGPHPGYKTEWWYYTGNLAAPEGRRFGYQLTFFRIALAPPADAMTARTSDWAANHIFMAHFALTDVAGKEFYAFERFSRGAAGLAGAQASPFRVWLEDWSAEESGEAMPAMHIEARTEDAGIDLRMHPAKPLILQGEGGYDRKGSLPGDASYYYSFTRLQTEGAVTVEGQSFTVTGLSWMDREWSTSALGKDQVGWDWFSLQLSDGRDLMLYQIRSTDGSTSPFSNGVLVDPEGEPTPLRLEDVEILVNDYWESAGTNGRYPSRWRLNIPSVGLSLEVTPYLANQELDLSVRYWEGAVQVAGTSDGKSVTGSGYVEMTGYEPDQRTAQNRFEVR